jgi:hypothetical protein
MVTPDDITRVLRDSAEPLSVSEIASKAGGDIRDCDAILWQTPLTLNSMHELFSNRPMPFENSHDDSPYKELCEILFAAWALYEDGLPGGSTKRATEDARLLWGRRTIEMLRESQS